MARTDDTEARAALRAGVRLLLIGLALMILGVGLAAFIERAGGVRLEDVRFRGPDGTVFSALVYTPPNATPETRAPGVLAVHGYVNTRETQSAFAIEFARRGYVVLALDQRGHGYSGGAATASGFGGPEGLAYLRALPEVNPDQIGLEGHSMGGWAVLAAAAAQPDGYRAMVLEGSSVGPPFSQPGGPDWPRNVAVVFSRFDEFAPLMWGVARGREVGQSAKLMELFATGEPVSPGRVYGEIAQGSGRMLHSPPVTHPGDHISTIAVGHALDWFAQTLEGGTPRPASDQIWWWKEIGTGMALVGFVAFLLGVIDALLAMRFFAPLRAAPTPQRETLGVRGWTLLIVMAAAPALTFAAAPIVAPPPLAPSALAPQAITNWLVIWALVNTAIGLAAGFLLAPRGAAGSRPDWRAIPLAVAALGIAYGAVWLAGLALVDFRFWIVALRPMSAAQAQAALIYLAPFTLFVWVSFRGMTALMTKAAGPLAQYGAAIAAAAAGFAALSAFEYGWLFATGALPQFAMPLNAIIALQFTPVLAALAILAVFIWRRTNAALPGALIGGALVTWYIVAGAATHVAL